MVAAQACDLRKIKRLGKGTDKVMSLIRKTIPFLTEDRYLHEDIMKATDIISDDDNINEIVDLVSPECSNI